MLDLPDATSGFESAGTFPPGTLRSRRPSGSTEGLGEREKISLFRGREVIGRNVPATPETEPTKTGLSSFNRVSVSGRQVAPSTTPVQLWEGVVKRLDFAEGAMTVLLTDKLGAIEEHLADISLEWVSEQDRDLVRLGAVFYLTLYKEISPAGTCKNSQELRFRRLPSWSKKEVQAFAAEAKQLLSKFKSKPLAADE